jgi:hypothetical protein
MSPVVLLPLINYRRFHDEIDENTGQGLITGGDNLSPVLLTLAINSKLRVSPQIFVKIQNGPRGYSGTLIKT